MAYNLNFSHYLPNTEQRIERLKGVINKRPVAIILHGYSTTELEQFQRPAPGAHRGAPPRDSDGREIITVRGL